MDHCIYAVTPEGKQQWQRNIRNITRSSPVVDANGDIHLSPNSFSVSLRPDGHKRLGYPRACVDEVSPLVAPGMELFISQPWRAFVAYAGKDLPFWRFDNLIDNLAASPVMSRDGVIYALDGHFLYAFRANWGPRPWRTGPWPMFRANARHTGRVAAP
jgi:outer membrane protein assembly factor BamB